MLKIAFTIIIVKQIRPNTIISERFTTMLESPKMIADIPASITIDTIANANR